MVTCPNCGTPATNDDVFCSGCGQRLPQAPAAGQPPLPPMPGPPPVTPSESSQPPQVTYTPPAQQPQVVQPTYQEPVTPTTYGQSQPQQPPVIQPSYSQAPPAYGQPPQVAQAPKKKSKGCLIAAAVVIGLVLCGAVIIGGLTLLPEIIDSGNPTPIPYNSGNTNTTTTTTTGETQLDVINNLDVSICYLYISPSSSDEWGEDWLWDIGTIEPGFSATFYIPVGETLDMQAEDCDGFIIDTQTNVYVPAEGLTYTLSP